MAKTGRPPHKTGTKSFKVSVPQSLYDYLGYLVRHSWIGASENEVAAYLLKVKVGELRDAEFDQIRLPFDDDMAST